MRMGHRVFSFASSRSDASGRRFHPPPTDTFALTLNMAFRRQLTDAERSHQCMGRMHGLVGPGGSLTLFEVDFVTDGCVGAPTSAQHISPEIANRGHLTLFTWVLGINNTNPINFETRRRLSVRVDFSPSALRLCTNGHSGGRMLPPRKCARGAELALGGVRNWTCAFFFHSNRRLGGGALTIRGHVEAQSATLSAEPCRALRRCRHGPLTKQHLRSSFVWLRL